MLQELAQLVFKLVFSGGSSAGIQTKQLLANIFGQAVRPLSFVLRLIPQAQMLACWTDATCFLRPFNFQIFSSSVDNLWQDYHKTFLIKVGARFPVWKFNFGYRVELQ
jgi:hypothetical protein